MESVAEPQRSHFCGQRKAIILIRIMATVIPVARSLNGQSIASICDKSLIYQIIWITLALFGDQVVVGYFFHGHVNQQSCYGGSMIISTT